LEVPNVPSTLG